MFAVPLSQPDQYSHNSLLHFLPENRTLLVGFVIFLVNQIVEVEEAEGGQEVGPYAEQPGKL